MMRSMVSLTSNKNETCKLTSLLSYLFSRKMEERDHRRWNLADLDNDGELSREEFKAFLHPEDQDHMKDIVVTETLEDIDKDGDGSINVDEYIGDMYRDDESEGAEGLMRNVDCVELTS